MKRTELRWILALLVIIHSTDSNELKRMSLASQSHGNGTIVRHKRYLDFIPKSRMFFRANVKANVLSPTNQLLAFAYGYRANYPIENDIKIKRRDVHDSLQEIIDHHGFDGRACISKLLCDATSRISQESGMFGRLFKLVFRPSHTNDDSPFDGERCKQFQTECPLRLLNLTPYTDL